MRIMEWLPLSAAGLAVSLAVAGTARAQGPDSAKLPAGIVPLAVVVAQVVDSFGVGIAEAEIVVLTRDSSIVKKARANAQGDVKLLDLPSGGPYTIVARQIGYRRARAKDVLLQNGDTLYYRFELPPLPTTTPHRSSR
jgi:hypothetical protein